MYRFSYTMTKKQGLIDEISDVVLSKIQQINASRKRARTLHAPTILKSRFSRAFCAHSDANNWSDWFIPTLIEG